MDSMIENSRPMFTERTDLDNAVYEEADVIMLSDKTPLVNTPLNVSRVWSKSLRPWESIVGCNSVTV